MQLAAAMVMLDELNLSYQGSFWQLPGVFVLDAAELDAAQTTRQTPCGSQTL